MPRVVVTEDLRSAAVNVAVVDSDVDTVALTAAADDPRAGAVVTFSGVVRNHDHGRAVTGIDYVGHPTADAILAGLARDLSSGAGIHRIVVRHRVGSLGIGGVALFVAVAASHRQQGFDCTSAVVERIKAELPIWKKQYFADGTHEWSQCP